MSRVFQLAAALALVTCTPYTPHPETACATPADEVYADVRGTVVDDAKHPVAGVRVSLHRDPETAKTTDAHGAFALSKVVIGKTACGHEDLDTAEVELDAADTGRVGRARATLHRGDNQLPPIAIAVPDTDIPTLPAILGVTATATSSAKGDEPWYPLRGDPTKFWCEGRADEGVGEALVLHFAEPTRVDSLRLRAGVWRSPDLFRSYNRVTQLRVVPDIGESKTVSFDDDRVNIDVAMGRDRIQTIHLEIAGVTKSKTNDTCISGVEIRTDPTSTVVLGEAPPQSLPSAFAKVWRALASCDDKALEAGLRFPFVASQSFASASAVRTACKSGAFADFRPQQASPFVQAEAPGKVVVIAGKLEWHFVLVGGAWRLASLEHAP
jgi:hypothetical protein